MRASLIQVVIDGGARRDSSPKSRVVARKREAFKGCVSCTDWDRRRNELVHRGRREQRNVLPIGHAYVMADAVRGAAEVGYGEGVGVARVRERCGRGRTEIEVDVSVDTDCSKVT